MRTPGIQNRIVDELEKRGSRTTQQLFIAFPDYAADINAFTANLTNMRREGKILRQKEPCRCCGKKIAMWLRTL